MTNLGAEDQAPGSPDPKPQDPEALEQAQICHDAAGDHLFGRMPDDYLGSRALFDAVGWLLRALGGPASTETAQRGETRGAVREMPVSGAGNGYAVEEEDTSAQA